MEAVLRFAPAPVLNRFWEAGAQALKTVRNLFAAKLLAANPAREDAQADVNARAAEILDTHGNAILRYAYSYLHNMEDAEEVLQDTLVQFLKTAPAFESEAHEKAWLLRVAGNLSKNRLSYNAVRAADELNDELVAENREDLSVGTEDHSGDWNEYPAQQTITAAGCTVTLKGETGSYTLAIWTDGNYSYSLSLSSGQPESVWQTIIEGVQ